MVALVRLGVQRATEKGLRMTEPNIVVIMAHQLAPQFTGAYGHTIAKTSFLTL